jgi:hypothetical protein
MNLDQLKVGMRVLVLDKMKGTIKSIESYYAWVAVDDYGSLTFTPENITIDSPIETPSSSAVINDHICPTCSNNRCSKSEKTCWRCGNKL